MGYSHSYGANNIDKIPEECLEKVRIVLKEKEWKEYLRFEYNTEKPPLISETKIRFNGEEGKGYESFVFSTKEGHEFCKTNEYDYDIPVCIVLLLLKNYIAGFELESDGFWIDKNKAKKYKETKVPELDGNWNKALDYVKEKFGIDFEWFLNETESGGWKYYKMEICNILIPETK